MPSERRQRQASCLRFSLRVEHEIALGRADTGQARAGIGLEVGLFDVVDFARKDGDLAGAATTGPAATRDGDAIGFGQIEDTGLVAAPVDRLAAFF